VTSKEMDRTIENAAARRGQWRRARRASALAAGVALFALGGCASSPGSMPRAQEPAPASYAPPSLTGVWRGTFNEIEAALYADNADVVLQIRDDGTFSERVDPAKGSNNLAKASTASGTVEQRGNRVLLKSSRGWTMRLVRSGDQLYGVTEDPLVEAPIAIRLQRVGTLG